MENNIESTIEVAEEVMDGVSKVHVTNPKAFKWIVLGGVATGSIILGVHFIRKAIRDKKGIVDGEILGVEEPEEDK